MLAQKVLFVGKIGGMCNVKYTFMQSLCEDYGFLPEFLPATKNELILLHGAGLPAVHGLRQSELNTYACIVIEDFQVKTALHNLCSSAVPIIQLWHGVPLKKIGFPELASAVNMTPEKAAYLAEQYSGYAAVPVTSQWMKETLFAKAFRADDFPVLGFARNDILLRPPTRNDMLGVDQNAYAKLKQHKKHGGKVVIYMPTFRDTHTGETLDDILHLDLLNTFCAKNNILFLLKVHPNIRLQSSLMYSHIHVYESEFDAYALLPMVDALITDYSSIYFDFLFLDRPIIFYAYDKEKYLSKDREMFFEYESMTPGMHVRTHEELLAAMYATLHAGHDPCKDMRKTLRDQVFTHHDSLSAHRICCYIQHKFVK